MDSELIDRQAGNLFKQARDQTPHRQYSPSGDTLLTVGKRVVVLGRSEEVQRLARALNT